MYEITGNISYIGNTMPIGDNGFTKREFTLTVVNGEYSEAIKLEFTGNQCDIMDHFDNGQDVRVKFVLKGRTLQTDPLRNFTNLRAIKIEEFSKGQDGANSAKPFPSLEDGHKSLNEVTAEKTNQSQAPSRPEFEVESEDDIPF